MSNGEIITKQVAKAMIDKFQEQNPNAIKAHLFDKSLIEQQLDDTNTDGIRIYHALDEDDVERLVLVCTDVDGNDLEDNVILERGTICPPSCDVNSYFK